MYFEFQKKNFEVFYQKLGILSNGQHENPMWENANAASHNKVLRPQVLLARKLEEIRDP